MSDGFEEFVARVEPSVRRALVGLLPVDVVPDGLGEAFAYAWENWDRVKTLENPAGYLVRVAQSRTRTRMSGLLSETPHGAPQIEPGLVLAMRSLSEQQRTVVWLVQACGWTYAEAGEALDISASAVGTHLGRAMHRLRVAMGVRSDA